MINKFKFSVNNYRCIGKVLLHVTIFYIRYIHELADGHADLILLSWYLEIHSLCLVKNLAYERNNVKEKDASRGAIYVMVYPALQDISVRLPATCSLLLLCLTQYLFSHCRQQVKTWSRTSRKFGTRDCYDNW